MLLHERANRCFTAPTLLEHVSALRLRVVPTRLTLVLPEGSTSRLPLALLLNDFVQIILDIYISAVLYAHYSQSLRVPDTVFLAPHGGWQPGRVVAVLMPRVYQVHALSINLLDLSHSHQKPEDDPVVRGTKRRVRHGLVKVSAAVDSRAQRSSSRRLEPRRDDGLGVALVRAVEHGIDSPFLRCLARFQAPLSLAQRFPAIERE